jgi:hypothetical protein
MADWLDPEEQAPNKNSAESHAGYCFIVPSQSEQRARRLESLPHPSREVL